MNIKRTALLLSLFFSVSNAQSADSTRPVEGVQRNIPEVHALTNATVVVRAGTVLEKATIVVRDGVIADVGADIDVPADARIWDATGKTIYPGFIDAYSETDVDPNAARGSTAYWNTNVVPELRVADQLSAVVAKNKSFREQGITVRLVAPDEGIVRGVSSVVTCGDANADESMIRHDVALHVRLGANRRSSGYPSSPMGAVALARQAFYDAQWHHDAWHAYRTQNGLTRPEQNRALEVLHQMIGSGDAVFFNTPDEQYLVRADAFAREFGINAVFVGSGHEYRRLADVKATGRPVIVPLQFPKAPNVATPEAANNVTLEQLLHWDLAPENATRLQQAGVTIALTAHGLSNSADFWKSIRTVVKRGLSPDAALRAVTETPAKLLQIEDQLGTVEPGKLAHLVVADGDLFDKDTKITETWIDGKRYEIKSPDPLDIRGDWTARGNLEFVMRLSGKPSALKGKITSGETTQDIKKPKIDGELFTATCDVTVFEKDETGVCRISAILIPGDDKSPSTLTGSVTFPSGKTFGFNATHSESKPAEDEQKEDAAESSDKDETEPDNAKEDTEENAEPGAAADNDKPSESSSDDEKASFEVNFPLGAFGVDRVSDRPSVVAFTNATVWSCGESDISLNNATVLVQDGVIIAVGTDVEIPSSAVRVNCEGKHISPGIIDCHSHMATDGGINEGSQAITSEVRVGDFIDANDMNIYRQLAGGVTAANVLHGSANPIGGQNQVIKLRWGMNFDGLKFKEAPAGIKFALGENVKRSRIPNNRRYPGTRMGVEQIIRDAFLRARQYRDRNIDWNTNRTGLPPRRDLELDALVEILEKKRWIHCHSYRQDEILALLRTLESFNIQIGTLQHILEGYKIADAMKKHGAMGSSFSDWWAYKFEVYDAIPYNGSIMHNVGIEVSFNSDDRELARHLNHEAAKAVKYGGVKQTEALKFVTLNPAKQLRIDHLVGSIEPGKHADLVVWSSNPLSTMSRCEQTWIDGRKYFDINDDQRDRKKWTSMRETLIQKILQSDSPMKKPGEKEKVDERNFWTRVDLYCTHRNQAAK
ncbi:MAG: amidohydrolase family protein [Planctomycetales bacterium]|nr:amidohydrolase family protein [Planctomycetales bacterium]